MQMNVKKFLKENKWFIGLIALFILVKLLLLLEYHLVIWDEAVYLGMGKFLFSNGQVGLWEPIRPIFWPLLLGFLWKINLNTVFLGEFLMIAFSTGILVMTYVLGKQIFNKNVGLIAMVLVGITPIFYLYSNALLTGIPATFLILLSLYFLLKENYWLGGLFSGLAFLTRFPAGLIIIGVAGVLLAKFYLEKENKKNLLYYRNYILIFVLVQVPFLIFNLLIYYSQTPVLVAIFRPYILAFSHQNNIFNSISFSNIGSVVYNYLFYFIELIKENILLIFFFLGLGLLIHKKEYKKYQKNLIFIPLVLFFFYFSLIANKQLRFALLFLPMFGIVAAFGINFIYEKIKKMKKVLYVVAFFVVLMALMTPALTKDLVYTGWRHKTEPAIASEYYKFLADKEADLVLTTDPVPTAYVDKKFVILYHDMDTAVKEYSKNIGRADYIIYFHDFYPCLDKSCEMKKELLYKYISRDKLVFNETYNGREYFIFETI